LALYSAYGLLRTLHLVPYDNRGLRRAYHLLLRAGTFWYSLLNPTNEAVQHSIASKNCAGEAPEGDSYQLTSAMCNAGCSDRPDLFMSKPAPTYDIVSIESS
jgi:hypothetical protein